MFFDFEIYQKIKMSNINVVQSCWNFAQLKEIKKYASTLTCQIIVQQILYLW